ncbi:MAG: hypothetical protein HY589_03170 [Candidatus Omnitrophica bacterium]|nr:hypothetical protein [Candidatus Omnitrophota bacterium]
MKYLVLPPLCLFLMSRAVCADLVLLKDGQELRGIIVEDYRDRVTLSSEKGEVPLLKKDIDKISYDTREENLVKLGAYYKDKGDNKRALFCYDAAFRSNPDMKEAQEGSRLLSNIMFKQRELDLEKEVALRQDNEAAMAKGPLVSGAAAEDDPAEAKKKKLWEGVGISIESVGGDIMIKEVAPRSPAYEAGVTKGDVLVSFWGRLVKYIPLREIYGMFLDSEVNELRLAVSRHKSVTLRRKGIFSGAEDMLGAALAMEFDGLTVEGVKPRGPFEAAGILKGDRIVQLGDVLTRYLPLESACRIIEGSRSNSLEFVIQRDVVFWRK